jgi:hypothetical protein
VPHWAQSYKGAGARELAQGALRIIGRSEGSRRPANGEDQQVVEMDNMADFGASRPEIQHRLRQIHYEAIDAYLPQPYGGSITLFRARAVRPRQMLFAEFDPLRGWGTLVGGRVQVRYVDGAHTTILHNPFAGDLAAQLNAALRSATANEGSEGK